jgi:DNA-binding NtrC family response regulator
MYRLRVIPIFVPPLRARPGDVSLLTDKLIQELNSHEGRRIREVSAAARKVLESYPWPGNVRELRNALEYAYVIGEGPRLDADELPQEIVSPEANPEPDVWLGRELPPAAALGSEGSTEMDPEALRIRRALAQSGGRRQEAADRLGMSRATLWRRMNSLGLIRTTPGAVRARRT